MCSVDVPLSSLAEARTGLGRPIDREAKEKEKEEKEKEKENAWVFWDSALSTLQAVLVVC